MSSHPISFISALTSPHLCHALPSSLFKFSYKNAACIYFLTNTVCIPCCVRHPRSRQQNDIWWEVHCHMLLFVQIITVSCYYQSLWPAHFYHCSVLCSNNVMEQIREHACVHMRADTYTRRVISTTVELPNCYCQSLWPACFSHCSVLCSLNMMEHVRGRARARPHTHTHTHTHKEGNFYNSWVT